MTVKLADVEAPLALFTEGIAGRYLHLRSREEFSLNPRLNIDLFTSTQTHDSVFLPEQLATKHPSAYRVLVMQQLGQRECGTFRFRLAEALDRLPELAARYSQPADYSPRTGDYRFFEFFPANWLSAYSTFRAYACSGAFIAHLSRSGRAIDRHQTNNCNS